MMMEVPIQVAVKVRPLIPSDRLHEVVCVNTLPYANQVILGNHKCFAVDFALPLNCTQSQLFDTVIQPMINVIIQGYDISVIAYGQTGSGKTYTILGPGLHCAFSETEYGIIPRATREIFNKLMQLPGILFKVKVTFIEIYEETIRDLLNVSQFSRDLHVSENQDGSTHVSGVEEVECQSVSEVFNWLHIGMSNRHVGWTAYRHHPSRSHSIFTLSLEQQWLVDGTLHKRYSKAQFTDLAGSERMFSVRNSGQILNENMYHDSGLVALGNVVAALNDIHWHQPLAPYTQSLLTRILKNSFGGTASTLMICCVSPASLDFDETLSSLRFVERVRNIKNIPVMNAYTFNQNASPVQKTMENCSSEDVCNVNGSDDDLFGLEFAASQWLKLVSNAEGLFSRIVAAECLPSEEKDEIERWLCLKQECEECVGSDDTTSLKVFGGRVLERIDELTESDTKVGTSQQSNTANDQHDSCEHIAVTCGSENESDVESQKLDFLDKLDDFIQKFKLRTDISVKSQSDVYTCQVNGDCDKDGDDDDGDESIVSSDSRDDKEFPIKDNITDWHTTVSPAPCPKALTMRRRSIHPGTEIPDLTHALNQVNFMSAEKQKHCHPRGYEEETSTGSKVLGSSHPEYTPTDAMAVVTCSSPASGPQHELRILSAGNEARQSEIRQVLIDLEGAHKRIEQLQYTIQIKEQFIGDMIKNSDMRASAKHRFQKKRTKLEEEYYKTRTHLAQAENALLLTDKDEEDTSEKQKYRKEIEKHKNLAMHYEKRLKDIEVIKQIAGDSAKKVLELENSLQSSKRQMEKLKKQLKKEEKHKQCLEQEIIEDQRKIKELEQKYNLQASTLREKNPDGNGEEERLRWIQEEEERIVSMRESSQRFKEQLLQQQTMLEKREAFLKEKLSLEKCRNKSLMEVSARISHLTQVLKMKSTDLEKAEDVDEKEAIRHEIRNLRRTRDCLVDQRCNLDEKYQREKTLSTVEERKLLECDEAIEAIDAAIEYKNELICGRKGQGLDNVQIQREKGEELLLARLMKLSPMEMRTLLYKYFQKVIDLRESGRKLEIQIAELDLQTEAQAWKIQALGNALQQAHLETDRRMVLLQKEHQEKLHLMLRHFADESSTSSGIEAGGKRVTLNIDSEVDKYRRENRNLKRKLHEVEALLHTASRMHRRSRSISPVTIPQQNLKQLQGTSCSPTTKVTRQKNKLIIQQHKSKKPTKL